MKKKCKHKHVTHIDIDQVARNRVYDDMGNIVEYDDFKLFIFNCDDCGEIVVKELLRSHFKASVSSQPQITAESN